MKGSPLVKGKKRSEITKLEIKALIFIPIIISVL